MAEQAVRREAPAARPKPTEAELERVVVEVVVTRLRLPFEDVFTLALRFLGALLLIVGIIGGGGLMVFFWLT